MDMKITGAYSQYMAPPARGRHHHAQHAAGAQQQGDKVSLSAQANDYAAAMRAIHQTPDVRQSIVGGIREMLASGAYNVAAEDVAERMFLKWQE